MYRKSNTSGSLRRSLHAKRNLVRGLLELFQTERTSKKTLPRIPFSGIASKETNERSLVLRRGELSELSAPTLFYNTLFTEILNS